MNNAEGIKTNGKQNAYFTLEASLIMPLVLIVIIFIMYVGFYSYDKCLLRQDTYRLLIRGSQVKNASNEDVMNTIKKEDLERNYDKYVMCIWEDKHVSVEHDSINIVGEGMLKVSIPFIDNLLGKNAWNITVEAKTTRIHPIDVIRSCRKIQSLLEKETK